MGAKLGGRSANWGFGARSAKKCKRYVFIIQGCPTKKTYKKFIIRLGIYSENALRGDEALVYKRRKNDAPGRAPRGKPLSLKCGD